MEVRYTRSIWWKLCLCFKKYQFKCGFGKCTLTGSNIFQQSIIRVIIIHNHRQNKKKMREFYKKWGLSQWNSSMKVHKRMNNVISPPKTTNLTTYTYVNGNEEVMRRLYLYFTYGKMRWRWLLEYAFTSFLFILLFLL